MSCMHSKMLHYNRTHHLVSTKWFVTATRMTGIDPKEKTVWLSISIYNKMTAMTKKHCSTFCALKQLPEDRKCTFECQKQMRVYHSTKIVISYRRSHLMGVPSFRLG